MGKLIIGIIAAAIIIAVAVPIVAIKGLQVVSAADEDQ